MRRWWLLALSLGACGGESGSAADGVVHVAVAANFLRTHEQIAEQFRSATGFEVRTSPGSSGALATQILNGAPFEVFLSADGARPRRLEEQGAAVPGTRFTYAVGRLALFVPGAPAELDGPAFLRGDFQHLAIAQPELAPYGAAARQTLERLGLAAQLEPRLVFGENVAQALHFADSGAADAAFVALAQVQSRDGGAWLVPPDLHDPIRQDAILLVPGARDPAARAFLEFLRGAAAQERIRAAGYDVEP